jgi:hypothetical protein
MTSADRMLARKARLDPVVKNPVIASPVQNMNWHSWSANDGVQALALLALLSYCATATITGPFRWAAGLVGLTPIIYFPQVLMLASTLAVVVWESRHGLQPLRAMTLLVIAYSILVGLFHKPFYQVLFGIYTLLPFWFGLSCSEIIFRHWHLVLKMSIWLWFVVVSGVILNYWIAYPWEGFGYSVGDLDVVSSREWENIGGGKRLAGFSRASFDAALQALLLGVIVVMGTRSACLRLLIWGITFLTIYMTTSKGVYNMFALLTPIVILGKKIPASAIRWWPLALGFVALLLPMTPLFMDVNFYIRDQELANLTFSFWDRLNDMWPNAWKLLENQGNSLWGRGLGGIGTPQTYFEFNRFNAADNIFVYWFVIFGWIALPGFLLLLLRSLRLNPWRDPVEAVAYCLLLATLVYGITANVVESGFFAIAAGMSVRYLFHERETIKI